MGERGIKRESVCERDEHGYRDGEKRGGRGEGKYDERVGLMERNKFKSRWRSMQIDRDYLKSR